MVHPINAVSAYVRAKEAEINRLLHVNRRLTQELGRRLKDSGLSQAVVDEAIKSMVGSAEILMDLEAH